MARLALIKVVVFAEVKDIMNASEQAELYARQAKYNQLIEYATEIRKRAQRRAGEMLAQTPKATGASGRFTGGSNSAPPAEDVPTLADMGITKKQSAHWQSLAAMSPEHFETVVATDGACCSDQFHSNG